MSKALWVFGLASAAIAIGASWFWMDALCSQIYDDEDWE